MPETRTDWYRLSGEDTLAALETARDGLPQDEAAARLTRYGPNVVREDSGPRLFAIFLSQVKSPLVIILLIAAVITAALKQAADSAVITAAVLLNVVVGFTQEVRAEKSVRALGRMVAPKARVLRAGDEREIPSRELVPGDIVLLESGRFVPADGRLLASAELTLDESHLTGESGPAAKGTAALTGEGLTPGDQRNMAFMGSMVQTGRGRLVVTATGAATALGTIAEQMRSIGPVRAPVQEKIDRFMHRIAWVVLAACVALFGAGVATGEPVAEMFLTAVAAAVATIPEGLPIAVTIVMAAGVRRMARAGAIIRRLPAVETLGSATVICSDKTGTLTVNEMTVRRVYAAGRDFELTGQGYAPEGDVLVDGQAPDEAALAALREALRIGLLCNDSGVDFEEGRWIAEGDPTESALVTAAMKAGFDPARERQARPEAAALPFDSDRGWMATLHDTPDGGRELLVKGGHDRLLALCPECGAHGGLDAATVREAALSYAAQGYRVLVLARRDMPGAEAISDADVGPGLVFLGLAAMQDPPRAEAAQAVADCRGAGIRVMMLTGDHAVTALAVARQVGIAGEGEEAVPGTAVEAMDEAELERAIRENHVFARITPTHKLRIVTALKRLGEVAAVTGDGVNDAPALKTAHIGVAMGRNGTDVAREAAAMVLADDNFATIFKAVREGRIVFDNLRKLVFFMLPTGIASIWSLLASVVMGLPMPFTAAQVLWINLVNNAFYHLALAYEPGEEGIATRPPRPAGEGVMSRLLVARTFWVSLFIGAGAFWVFLAAYRAGLPLAHARTEAMTVMVLFQFFQSLNSRSEHRSVLAMNPFNNTLLILGLALAVAMQVAVVTFGPLKALFRTTPLSAAEWAMLVGIAATVVAAVEIDKLLRRLFVRRERAVPR